MNKEKLLLLFLGIRILGALYYLPIFWESLLSFSDTSLYYQVINLLGQCASYVFIAIAAIGLFQYFQNDQRLNSFLKFYFIYFLFGYILYFPSLIGILIKFWAELDWMFFILNSCTFIMCLLILLVYGDQKYRLRPVKTSLKSIRFWHFLFDSFIILISIIELRQAYSLFIDVDFLEITDLVNLFILGIITFIGYYLISEAVFQQTLGKVLTNQYVAKTNGQKAEFLQIVSRSLTRAIIIDVFSFLRTNKKGWHDEISGTTVYKLDDGWMDEGDELMKHLIEKNEI